MIKYASYLTPKNIKQAVSIAAILALISIAVLSIWVIFFGHITILEDTGILKTINRSEGKELLRNQIIQGNIHANSANLGIISVRFTNFGRINDDIVIFRLKGKQSNSWLYRNTYKVNQFQPDEFFPFGFPIISDSVGKDYIFEIESMRGIHGNAIGISRISPIVKASYSYSKQTFIHHPIIFLTVLAEKVFMILVSRFVLGSLLLIYVFILLISQRKLYRNDVMEKELKAILKLIGKLVRKHYIYGIVLLGLFFRILLSTGPYNADVVAFMNASTFFQRHLWNVYAHTNGYNYSPVIFFLFGLLAMVNGAFHILSFPFLWRLCLSLIDLGSLSVLMKIARMKKINPVRTAILFFLNPISIIVSGHHGQFENIAILFLLLALCIHYQAIVEKKSKMFLQWIYLTIGMLVKHIIIFQLLVFWKDEVKRTNKVLFLFLLSLIVFLATFIPYWFGAKDQIIRNVFLYGGVPGDYGITYLLVKWLPGITVFGMYQITLYKYLFMTLLFGLPLFIKGKDIARNMLWMFLFFITFTSGIGVQYFVLPIALGSLFPSKWFYLYSIMVGLGYLGGLEPALPFHIPGLSFISFNVIWIFAGLWFISELLYLSKTARMLYHRYIYSA